MAAGGASSALQALHYLTPVLSAVYFILAKTIANCLLQKPLKAATTVTRKRTTIILLIGVLLTIIAQGLSYVVQAFRTPGYAAAQDEIVYTLGELFLYFSLTLGLAENKNPIWHPHVGAWLLASVNEVACTALQAVSGQSGRQYVQGRAALHAIRALLLLVLWITAAAYTLRQRRMTKKLVEETEPLLANGANGHAPKPQSGASYGSVDGLCEGDDSDAPKSATDGDGEDVDSDDEYPDRDKELKAQQQKRLAESGSYWAYMKDFRVFIPMLWPSRNPFVQACLGVVGLIVLFERFLNVLVPRQIGILTDELARDYGTGKIPTRALVLWMTFAWLQSNAGLRIIKSLAELPLQQFAYRSIGTTAFKHVMELSMDFHNEKNSGELIRAIDQGQHLQGLLEFMCFEVGPMFIDLVVALVYVYTLFDVYMALILLVVGVAYVWIGAKTTLWSIKRRRRFNNAWRNESKVQNEAINNWQTVSHFNRGAYEVQRYDDSIKEFNTAERRYYYVYYAGSSTQSLIMRLGRLSAMTLAVVRVAQGRAPIGHFITLVTYWTTIESPLAQVSWSIRRVSQMLTDSERLLQLMLTKPSVTSLPDAPDLVVKSGEIEFDNVSFSYDPRKPTLREVSFKAKPGQTIALVGETGGGKSTILKLLYRYYDINEGAIRIDGQDIRNVTLDSLRDSFGMVPQDPALFNVSLMENIKYARLDATEDEVTEACRAAAIHDKIMSFPDQYKSTVGERGVKLSGGELQRVAIARAILRQPKLVLLDEATSAVDSETEQFIQKALKRLTANRTTFVIAHRLSTIQHADQILVINDGQIIERGTHEELFRQNGKYTTLWSKQLSKDVPDGDKTLDVDKDDQALIDLAGVEPPTAKDGSGGADAPSTD